MSHLITPLTFPDEAFFLQWHITDACNLRCRHCYCTDFTYQPFQNEKISFILEQYRALLDYLHKPGRVQFAGGEPFASPILFDAIRYARELGMAVRVLSNGTLASDEICQKLKEAGCYIVQVSIEGKKKTNDFIRMKGSYKKALEGMKLMREHGIEITVAMTLSRTNFQDIEHVFKLASRYANRIGFHRLVPIGTGKSMQKDMLLPEELLSCYEKILLLKKEYPELDVPLRDPLWQSYISKSQQKSVTGCSAGYNGLCIGSNGDVYPCRRLPVKIGNVFEESLIELWHHEIMKNLRERSLRKGECGECESRNICGGCPGIAYGITGDYMASDPQCLKKLKPDSRIKDFSFCDMVS